MSAPENFLCYRASAASAADQLVASSRGVSTDRPVSYLGSMAVSLVTRTLVLGLLGLTEGLGGQEGGLNGASRLAAYSRVDTTFEGEISRKVDSLKS